MIDLETWVILAERLETIRREREKDEPLDVTLTFDGNDQARVVPDPRQRQLSAVGSVAVSGRVSP